MTKMFSLNGHLKKAKNSEKREHWATHMFWGMVLDNA